MIHQPVPREVSKYLCSKVAYHVIILSSVILTYYFLLEVLKNHWNLLYDHTITWSIITHLLGVLTNLLVKSVMSLSLTISVAATTHKFIICKLNLVLTTSLKFYFWTSIQPWTMNNECNFLKFFENDLNLKRWRTQKGKTNKIWFLLTMWMAFLGTNNYFITFHS